MWSQPIQFMGAWWAAAPEQQVGVMLFVGGFFLVMLSLLLKHFQSGRF